jgi:hypothetical protein
MLCSSFNDQSFNILQFITWNVLKRKVQTPILFLDIEGW